nr:hypothetical protein [Tanacetum cinerariifolium]
MSSSEPGEMAPESSMAVVFPKFDMHIYTSEFSSSKLGKAVEEYSIPWIYIPVSHLRAFWGACLPASADGG